VIWCSPWERIAKESFFTMAGGAAA
jgi:hypothetical protein